MLSFQSNPDSAPAPPVFLPSPNAPVLQGAPPNYKFVTGSPSDWTPYELSIFQEGLARYAREPTIMKYIKIAAMLPTKTIRDVALRCRWTAGKESRRRKPDEFYAGKRIRDLKEKMVPSTSLANFQMALPNSLVPFSTSMHHPGQNSLATNEVPVLDNATQHLLEENIQLLNQISANIGTFKVCMIYLLSLITGHILPNGYWALFIRGIHPQMEHVNEKLHFHAAHINSKLHMKA